MHFIVNHDGNSQVGDECQTSNPNLQGSFTSNTHSIALGLLLIPLKQSMHFMKLKIKHDLFFQSHEIGGLTIIDKKN
jgi:hypothetical protein